MVQMQKKNNLMLFMIVSTVENRLCPTKYNYNGFNVSYHVTIVFEYLIIVYIAKYEKYKKCYNILCVVFDAVIWVVINS